MEDYKTIKTLKELPEFEKIIEKITTWSNENDGINFNDDEKVFLLSNAMILLRKYCLDKRCKSYAELAYYIILKYSLITNDYTPLYDFSINFGFYPIAKSLVEKEKIKINNIVNCNIQSFIEHKFSYQGLTETYDQKKIRKTILESKSNEICFIAPTSYGKSSLIIEDIRKNLELHKTVSIIVPTKSLLTQTFRNLKKENLGQKIILHDEMYEKEERFISVLTQERALRLLFKNPTLYFDSLYIDEAHNLFNKDSRTVLLSRLIRFNKKRNPSQKVIYLSPLISNSNNLKLDSEQNIVEQKINFNMKEPEIYELCLKSQIQKYNRFIDKFYILGKQSNYLDYIEKTMKGKNFFFLIAPKKVEMFAKDLYNQVKIELEDKEINNVIENLKKYIHEDFYGINYLKKGIVYLHGQLPDNIKEYLEYKFQTIDKITFLVANSVVLEGINMPINSLYILNTHGLRPHELINLIGRVNRLNMVFNPSNNDYSLLLPNIHFVNTEEYGRKNSNMSKKIEKLRTGRFPDEIENPLLVEFDIDKVKKMKNRDEAKQTIEEENFVLDNSSLSEVGKIKKKMLELGMNDIYNINDFLCEMLISRISKIDSKIEKEIIAKIQEIFVDGLDDCIKNEEFRRLKNDSAVKYYENFVLIAKKKSLKDNIKSVLSHFQQRKNSNSGLMFIGVGFGEVTYKGKNNSKGKNVYVDLKEKSDVELVNLAIVKLSIENKFVSFTLTKFFQLMLDCEIISTQYYNMLVYGSNNKIILNLLKQGLSINVINRLDADDQIKNIFIDNSIAHGNDDFQKYRETLDDFFKFELEKYFN